GQMRRDVVLEERIDRGEGRSVEKRLLQMRPLLAGEVRAHSEQDRCDDRRVAAEAREKRKARDTIGDDARAEEACNANADLSRGALDLGARERIELGHVLEHPLLGRRRAAAEVPQNALAVALERLQPAILDLAAMRRLAR